MNRTMIKMIGMLLAVCMLFAGCVTAPQPAAETAPEAAPAGETATASGDPLKVAFLCHGTLGDLSFFDSAAEGIKKMEEELNVEAKIVETGYDTTKWEPALLDLADSDYDIIIAGTFNMVGYIQEAAKAHPEKKFILFDSEVDNSNNEYPNVYSIVYKYNEGSFLVGALCGLVTSSSMPHANPEKVISCLCGQDNPTLNDFLVGYIEGALYVDPEVKVACSYLGTFDDTAKGKEMAAAHISSLKADTIYGCAGGAGLGCIDAAKEGGVYAIGMASDQSALYKESDPDKSNIIISSLICDIGLSIFNAVKQDIEGTLPWGTTGYLGIADDAIGICENEVYNTVVPEDIRAKVAQVAEDVKAGKVTISSALTMTAEEVVALREKVAP